MSENEANPGIGGTNAHSPVAGQASQAGDQPGAEASPHGEPYGSASPWSRPDTDPSAPNPPAPQTPQGQTQPVPQTQPAPQASPEPQTSPAPAFPSGSEPVGYTVQLPASYDSGQPYPASYPSSSYSSASYPQASYPQASYPQSAYGQPASPYAQASSGSPYGGGGVPPTYAGQTITGLPPMPPLGGDAKPAPSTAWRRIVVAGVAAVALALVSGGVGGFVGYALHSADGGNGLQNISAGDPKNAAPIIDRGSLASVAKAVQPAVVAVKTQGGEGSGVVISADGYIVTNNHVVASGSGSTVQVTFNSGKSISAKIVGTDPKTDLAVVKADATGLVAATWADSDAIQVGDTVLAIGSPLGLEGSVTAGIISALHRTIQVGGDQQSPLQPRSAVTTIGDAIQTDAPINPGNSGGALVDTNGKVVGINSAIATSGSGSSGNIGLGFAISANKAKSVADQLIKGGKVSHPYLGVSLGDASDGGAQVQSVQAGSPAATAGVQEGDVVTKVDGRTISNSEELVGAIQTSSPGAKMNLTVMRNGSQSTVTVTIGDQP